MSCLIHGIIRLMNSNKEFPDRISNGDLFVPSGVCVRCNNKPGHHCGIFCHTRYGTEY